MMWLACDRLGCEARSEQMVELVNAAPQRIRASLDVRSANMLPDGWGWRYLSGVTYDVLLCPSCVVEFDQRVTDFKSVRDLFDERHQVQRS